MLKSYMETVILCYLMDEGRTGRELMDDIERDTGVRLSPGRVYPALHGLVKRGLLETTRGVRQVVYRPASRADVEREIGAQLDACAQLVAFLHDLSANRRHP